LHVSRIFIVLFLRNGGESMKQKKPGRKLNLNKKTIAALDFHQVKAAYGGGTGESACFCQPCEMTNPSCPITEDPTATVLPRICPCCF
jgi:hypothetical protein